VPSSENYPDPGMNVSVSVNSDSVPTVTLFDSLILAKTPYKLCAWNESVSVRLLMSGLDCAEMEITKFDWHGVTLKDAKFEDCYILGRPSKWQAIELENVALKGKIRGEMIIKTCSNFKTDPDGFWLIRTAKFYEQVRMSLDLSDVLFDEYPDLNGLPAETIKRGPGQFVIDYSKLKSFARADYPKTKPGRFLSVMSDCHGNGYENSPAAAFLNKTGVFVVPLLAQDGQKQLEDCKELVDLGLLSP
jgi:hypothetical protein